MGERKETPTTGLPPGIEAAWGLRERPGRGPRRGLSTERIVGAGIELAAAEGIEAVSMARVAAELGVSAMALYRYVAAKDELIVLMEDAAVGPPPDPPEVSGWRAGLTSWARAHRAVLHRNLWLLRLPISTPPATPHSVAWMEQGLRHLSGTALEVGEKLGVLGLVGGYVRTEASLTADLASAARRSGGTVEEASAAYGRLLARLADPERFPEVRRVVDSGVLTGPQAEDEEFEFGLARVLDGVEVMVEERGDAGS
ncbi:TetR/AcrR family transcriptional regulator [Streptomyces chumphonensis]|uniref:TetR/AcrR family transcriptional regulator n=1 Tax=Streptomyces chumphonensis TaxID=1214925 RepID=UPI003D71B3B2